MLLVENANAKEAKPPKEPRNYSLKILLPGLEPGRKTLFQHIGFCLPGKTKLIVRNSLKAAVICLPGVAMSLVVAVSGRAAPNDTAYADRRRPSMVGRVRQQGKVRSLLQLFSRLPADQGGSVARTTEVWWSTEF